MTHTLASQEAFETWARTYGAELLKEHEGSPLVFGLTGPLGAGKTTFVRALLRSFGVSGPIPSPTFLIMKEYTLPFPFEGKERVVHIDAYRIDNEQELLDLDVDEYMRDPATLTIVEWAGLVPSVMPDNTHWLSFEPTSETTRAVTQRDTQPHD